MRYCCLSIIFLSLLSSLHSQNFQLERTFEKHKSPVSYVSFRAEDNLLVSGDESGYLILWNSEDGSIVHEMKAHNGLITHIAFSPDAFKIASASYDGTIKIWNLRNYELLHEIKNSRADVYDDLDGDEPSFAVFTPNNKGIIYGGYNLEVLHTDFATGSTKRIFQNPYYAITCGLITPDGKSLAIGYGSTVQFISLKDFKPTFDLNLDDQLENYICELAFRPQEEELSAWLYDGRLLTWDYQRKKVVQRIQATNQEGTSNVAFSGNGSFLVTGNQGSHTKLWDVENEKVIQLLKEHNAEVVTFDYSQDGVYIVTGSRDHLVNLWKKRVPKPDPDIKLPKKEKNRTIENQEVVYLENETIDLLFWDNRKIDGDIISVNLNGNWVLEEHLLDVEPKKITVKFTQSKNYLFIHAHNEGDIKPNTIALTIRDGERVNTLTLRSDLKTSAAVSFIYKK